MLRVRTCTALLLCAMSAAGCICAQPARPTALTTSIAPPDALDGTIRVLAQNGFMAARVDDRAGVFESQWQATQFMYGQSQYQQTRYVARRTLVTVAPQGAGSQIIVQMQDMACVDPSAFIAGDGAYADCVAVDGLVAPDQELLDRIGAQLATSLGGPGGPPGAAMR
jgi:hypothetical protein